MSAFAIQATSGSGSNAGMSRPCIEDAPQVDLVRALDTKNEIGVALELAMSEVRQIQFVRAPR